MKMREIARRIVEALQADLAARLGSYSQAPPISDTGTGAADRSTQSCEW